MQDRKYITNIYIALSRCFLSLCSGFWGVGADRSGCEKNTSWHAFLLWRFNLFFGESGELQWTLYWLNFILSGMCILDIILVNYHHSLYVHFWTWYWLTTASNLCDISASLCFNCLLTGGNEEGSFYLFKIELRHSLCARDEWSAGASVLCFQDRWIRSCKL